MTEMRKRVVVILVFLLGLAGFVGLPSAATSAPPPNAELSGSADPPYGDPMATYLFEGRIFDGYDTPSRAGVNYAVAWLRVTDYTAKELRIFDKELYSRFDRYRGKWAEPIYRKIRTAAEIRREDPELYKELTKLGMKHDDVTMQVVARSSRYRGEAVGHAEELILRRLGEIEYTFEKLKQGRTLAQIEEDLKTEHGLDIGPKRLIGGASEREPCDYSGGPRCARYSKGMRALVRYGSAKEQKSATARIKDLIRRQNEWRDKSGDGLFEPPPTGTSSPKSGSKGNSDSKSPRRMAAGAAIGGPGGIDFRTVELRHLSANPGEQLGFNYGLIAQPGSGQSTPPGLQSLREASDSLFVWLALRPSKLWVNLNPNEPDRIVDKQLGRTDAGRILLEADLRLKKVTSKLLYRDTKLARQFWSRSVEPALIHV